MKVLILEDDINRINEFRKRFIGIAMPVFVDTAKDAIDFIKANAWLAHDMICLDHDLGGETYVDTAYKNTGSEVARYLFVNPVDAAIIIHSLNTPAADFMADLLADSHLVFRIPFFWTKNTFDKWL